MEYWKDGILGLGETAKESPSENQYSIIPIFHYSNCSAKQTEACALVPIEVIANECEAIPFHETATSCPPVSNDSSQ
jgi:hypothetical protein